MDLAAKGSPKSLVLADLAQADVMRPGSVNHVGDGLTAGAQACRRGFKATFRAKLDAIRSGSRDGLYEAVQCGPSVSKRWEAGAAWTLFTRLILKPALPHLSS